MGLRDFLNEHVFVASDEKPQSSKEEMIKTQEAKNSAPTSVNSVAVATQNEPTLGQELYNTVINKRVTPFNMFTNQLKPLENVIPDEATRYKAVFSLIQQNGQNLEQIVQAVELHMSDLSSEVSRFEQQANSVQDQKIKTKENEIVTLTDGMSNDQNLLKKMEEDFKKQTQAINDRIAQNANKIANLNLELQSDKQAIEQRKHEFMVAVEFVKQKLNSIKNNMLSFLK